MSLGTERAELRSAAYFQHHQSEDEALALALDQGGLLRWEPGPPENVQHDLDDPGAVLGDLATIIRSVVLPSVMTLLGRAGWYLPRCLDWLPRLEVERGLQLPVADAEAGAR